LPRGLGGVKSYRTDVCATTGSAANWLLAGSSNYMKSLISFQ